MSSSFDALLDFGDSTPAENGTSPQTNMFDPFGPSPTIETKGSASSDLLGDFSFDSQISGSNGQSVNPLYELSMSTGAKNSTDHQSVNPLYDFDQSDFSLSVQKPAPSANPLYDFMSGADTNGHSADLIGTENALTMETSNAQDEDNLLSSIDAKLKEKSETEESSNVDLLNGDGGMNETELVNGNGENKDQDLMSLDTEVQKSEDIVTIESLEKESESEDQLVDTKDQVVDTGDENVDSGSHLFNKEDQVVDTNEQVVDTGDQLVDTGDQLVNTGDQLVDTGDQLVETVETNEASLINTEEMIDSSHSEGNVIVEDDDMVEKNISEDFDPSAMVGAPQMQVPDSQPVCEEPYDEPEATKEPEFDQEQTQGEQLAEDEGLAEDTPVREEIAEVQETVVDEAAIEAEPAKEDEVRRVEKGMVVQEEENIIKEDEIVHQEEAEDEDGKSTGKTVETTMETTTKSQDAGSGKVTTTTTSKSTKEVIQNGDVGSPEEIRFDEMSNIKTKFESGGAGSTGSQSKPNVQEEIMSVEGGVYENEPVRDPNVVREADRGEEELPEAGYAKNIMNKFKQIQTEKAQPVTSQTRVTPDRQVGQVEYSNQPKESLSTPEQKIEGGIFENTPVQEEGVVRSYDSVEDVKPEQGYAKNVLAKFKEIESTTKNRPPPSPKKELTPDRFTKGEYVSEPRTVFENYESKVEAGIFESHPTEDKNIVKSGEVVDEPLPERGTAKNLVSKFAQYESQAKSPPSPRQKKELTPDRHTKGEYVSEPRTVFQHYEAKEESGIYESQPKERAEVVKSGEYYEEPLPEEGYAKNVISKFREIQSGASPVSSPQRPREITPPRGDTFAGVLESTPQERPDVVKSDQQFEEALPEAGTAKNLVSKFRQIQNSSQSPTSPRQKKEFTPPPQSGVYENTPQKSLVVENRPAESGILETTPLRRDDVAREADTSSGDIEFPESGYAKNMVSKWKQIENESAKSTPSPRYKEFTPPRDDVRTARGPLSPRSPAGVDSSVHPNDLPGQYQEQVSPGIFENQPEKRADILREDDTDWSEGLPKEGTSKSLISKFKQVQADAKKSEETPKPISRKDSTDDSTSHTPNQMFEKRNENDAVRNGVHSSPKRTPKGNFTVQLDKCAACEKTVYAMEKVEMNKNLYHRACFKCSHCNARLTAKTFSLNEGVIYCTNHFKQLFARKGNYDEGFGRQQYKKRWHGDQPNEESPSNNSA